MSVKSVVMDGNTAAAHVAYRVNEVCAIFPITPSSTMAELADAWAAQGTRNIWGQVPVIQQMQSEGGAAGAVHGALQSGALTTTFTASQGLLLMLPNMYKIAGELTPCVFHIAARAIATQALSIFGDHSDVMSARMVGFAMLAAASVQEAHDLALVAQVATLESRVPFMFFFDGFRTSHEENKISLIPDEQIREAIDDDLVRAHRARALTPERPVIRGTAHNPDTFFQARESANLYYAAVPGIVQRAMDRVGALVGRSYRLFRYSGHPEAERVVIVIGSAFEVLDETAGWLNAHGEKVGVLHVTLYRPWDAEGFRAALPPTVTHIAVLDRTKEAGGPGEPLYLDVVTTYAEALAAGRISSMPVVVGGRYGLSSKDFDPAMAKTVFDELKKPQPKRGFTIGITDDVSHTSLPVDASFDIEPPDVVRALFYGLGADGTVGANKNSTKILAEDPNRHAQGYFVYDSKKSGSYTISHLRFGPRPVRAPYLLKSANFVGVHKFDFLYKLDTLEAAAPGATVLINSPYGPDTVWDELPREVQQQIVGKRLKLHVIDASKVAAGLGLGSRVNTILQTCFFALSGVMPKDQAIESIKRATEKTYARKGKAIVQKNFAAIDSAVANLHEVRVPATAAGQRIRLTLIPDSAPAFVRNVIAPMLAMRGDTLPVSALPVDGTYPVGTTRYEKRNIADEVPIWESDLCIQCGQCAIVCPHSVIRAKYYDESRLAGAPEAFRAAPINARGYPESRFTLQVYVEDCTGCGVCVENCPAHSPDDAAVKAINMKDRLQHVEAERENVRFFESLPWADRTQVNFANVRGVQFLEPLFEFSGACAGCGETPYLKLMSQLFGDRLQIANATGCSSIYGGNLPTTPWAANAEGRGPAWANSLFEDNAEFGLGYRLAIDSQTEQARTLAQKLAPRIGGDLGVGNPAGAAGGRVRFPGAAPAGRGAEGSALGLDRSRRRQPARARRLPGAPIGVDRRRRRLGLRHRLRRPRPRARVGQGRQHHRARHRGLFEHRRTGIEGDAARGHREVRDRREDHAAQGPGADGRRLRQGLRRADRDGGEQRAGAGRDARGRGLSGNVADPGVLAMHRARHRHAPRHEAGGPGRRLRLLAAVPLRSDDAGTRPEPVPARLTAAAHSAGGVSRQRSPLQVAGPDPSGPGQAPARRGAARTRGAVPPLRGPGDARRQPVRPECHVMKLGSRYLGLQLAHPIVAAASPLTATLDGMRRLEDAGAAAVVMASLYEEQIRAEDTAYALFTEHGSESQAEATSYFPELPDYDGGVSGYLETVSRASASLAIPVIASLNGTTADGWITYARSLEQAGAAAIELNLYSLPVDLTISGAEIERRYIEIVRQVRASVRIPIAVKLAPYFTSVAHIASELVGAGADGLVLFNRFYAPDIDLSTLRVTRSLPLSTAAELPLSLVWIALLSRRLPCSLAASRGVESEVEVVKYLLAGADVVTATSALLRHGPEHVATMLEGLERWLGANGFDSVDAIRGLKDATHVEHVDELFRAQYVASLTEYLPGKLV